MMQAATDVVIDTFHISHYLKCHFKSFCFANTENTKTKHCALVFSWAFKKKKTLKNYETDCGESVFKYCSVIYMLLSSSSLEFLV